MNTSKSIGRKVAEEIVRRTGLPIREIGPVKMVGTRDVNRFMRDLAKLQRRPNNSIRY